MHLCIYYFSPWKTVPSCLLREQFSLVHTTYYPELFVWHPRSLIIRYYFSDYIGEFKRSEGSNSSGIGQLKTVQNSKSCQWTIIWFVFFSPKSLNIALFFEEMKYLLYYFISNKKWLASVYRFFSLQLHSTPWCGSANLSNQLLIVNI